MTILEYALDLATLVIGRIHDAMPPSEHLRKNLLAERIQPLTLASCTPGSLPILAMR
jgi:hypothetical protein